MKSTVQTVENKEESKGKSHSPDQNIPRSRSHSASRNKSDRKPRKYSRTKSNSSSPSPIRHSRRKEKRNRSVSRSISPTYYNRHSSPTYRHVYNNSCLGVFGMSLDTTERTLENEFSKFGKLEKVKVIRNVGSGTSRGFAFVYFEEPEDARKAREALNGKKEIDGHAIRIDYSVGRRERSMGSRSYSGRPYYSPYYTRYDRYHESRYYGSWRDRRTPSPYSRRRSSFRRRSRSRSHSARR